MRTDGPPPRQTATPVSRLGSRPLDWSMNLLNAIVAGSIDPDYQRLARRPRTRGSRVLTAVTLLLAAALISIAGVHNTRSKPAVATERAALIAQITKAQADNAARRQQLASVEAQVRGLQGVNADPSVAAQVAALDLAAGSVPVTGPGIVIVIDDGPETASGQSVVVDTDLRQVVNGLWQAGAEAIAINGHRLSNRTAIRAAGTAITVDYVSLNRPYRLEAIGDPKALPAAFAATTGGLWLTYLNQNYGITSVVSTAPTLDLPADPGLTLDEAKKPK